MRMMCEISMWGERGVRASHEVWAVAVKLLHLSPLKGAMVKPLDIISIGLIIIVLKFQGVRDGGQVGGEGGFGLEIQGIGCKATGLVL